MRTALYEKHLAFGAKMVDFAGWEMPLQYPDGILHERNAVRERAGLFDVSHMGRILIEGPDSERLLDLLSANTIKGRRNGSVTYTVWCHPNGGAVDDLLVYRTGAERLFVVANASNRQKDLDHLLAYSKGLNLSITPLYDGYGILALQGPRSQELVAMLFPEASAMRPMRVSEIGELVVATSGYTGEDGFEFMGPNQVICDLWDEILQRGDRLGIEPAGLAARDLLRLEMGYALYGHELTDEILPTESVSAWTVKLAKESFIGKEALLAFEESGTKRVQIGVRLLEPGVARAGYPVVREGEEIGLVTSGSHSPALQASIAIAMVSLPLAPGDPVEVLIRNRTVKAVVVPFPFIPKEATHEAIYPVT